MRINEIYTAYISWAGGGKRRPILIMKTNDDSFSFFKITSKYQSKSDYIKAHYYPIQEWEKAGLNKQSYIDTLNLLDLPNNFVNLQYVGHLTRKDRIGLSRFIEDLEFK